VARSDQEVAGRKSSWKPARSLEEAMVGRDQGERAVVAEADVVDAGVGGV
jgi:hypothetical protein